MLQTERLMKSKEELLCQEMKEKWGEKKKRKETTTRGTAKGSFYLSLNNVNSAT